MHLTLTSLSHMVFDARVSQRGLAGGPMAATTAFRHKHLRIDQVKLDRARRILEAGPRRRRSTARWRSVVSEARIDAAPRGGEAGKARKVFRPGGAGWCTTPTST